MDWRSIKFDWNRARAFLVTAEEGSFSAAARALGTTQPTLGRQVAALEQELGVSLFERVGGGLELTAGGHDLLEHVRTMGEAANNLSLFASGRAEAIEGDVCITATEDIAAFVLPPIIKNLRLKCPGINIELIASGDTSDLMRREADIAIRAFKPEQPELIARKIKNVNVHLYAAKTYLANVEQRDCPNDLSSLDFIGFDKSDRMIAELNQRGFVLSPKNFPLIVKSHLVQWELVKQGVGIGFMTETIGDNESSVERVLPDFDPFIVGLWLVVHRELKTSRRLRTVFDFLVSELT
jgi:DNA-binding transcriptional LysR family regulator